MLVLTRRVGEEIVIGGNIRVAIVGVNGNKVRVGVTAPPSVSVNRAEVEDRLEEEGFATLDFQTAEAVSCSASAQQVSGSDAMIKPGAANLR